jgi:hypothetical protein
MKFTILQKKFFLFIIFLIFITFLNSPKSIAWTGYDYFSKTEIDIGVGNLVREGNLIQFYDSKDDNFRTAKVVSIQSVAGGTEVIVFDLDSKKERQFIMY